MMRYTERFFSNSVVDDRLVGEAVEAANQRPTSCNLQLNKFIYLQGDEELKFLRKNVTRKANWCSAVLIVLYDRRFTWERNANALSAGIVVEGLIEELSERGLSSCPIAGFYGDEKLRKRYGIPDFYEVPLLLFIGYGDSKSKDYIKPFRSNRKNYFMLNKYASSMEFSSSRKLNGWGSEALREYRARIQTLYADRDVHSPFYFSYYDSIFNSFDFSKYKNVAMIGSPPFGLVKRCASEHSEILFTLFTHDYLLPYAKKILQTSKNVNVRQIENNVPMHFDCVLDLDRVNTECNFQSLLCRFIKSKKTRVFYCGLSFISPFGIYYNFLSLFSRDAYHKNIFYKAGAIRRFKINKFKTRSTKWISSGYSKKLFLRLRLAPISRLLSNDLFIKEVSND